MQASSLLYCLQDETPGIPEAYRYRSHAGSPRSHLDTRRRGGSRGDEHIGSVAGNTLVSPHFHDGGEFEGAGNRTSLTPGGGRLPTSPLSSPFYSLLVVRLLRLRHWPRAEEEAVELLERMVD